MESRSRSCYSIGRLIVGLSSFLCLVGRIQPVSCSLTPSRQPNDFAEIIHITQPHSHQYTRELQDDAPSISEPRLTWTGFRFNMDYVIPDYITDEMIFYGIYIDKSCVRDIPSQTDQMEVMLITIPVDDNQETPPAGFRVVRLSFLLDPKNMLEANYVTYQDTKAVVSLCVKLWIKSQFSVEIVAIRENHVMIEVEIKPLTGILGIIEDQSYKWGVSIFRCDSNMELVSKPLPVRQGERVRLCITPDDAARNDGVYLSSINYFSYQRDDIIQSALVAGQTSGDGGSTEVLCNRGSDLCAIDTALDNRFFHSPGQVIGSGSVFLQFGSQGQRQRHLLRRPVLVDFKQPVLTRNRVMYAIGETVGEKNVGYSVAVTPHTETFSAIAFRCDHLNMPISSDSTLQYGESVRICIQPDERAQSQEVYIRRIGSFFYHKDGRSQGATESDGSPDLNGKTLVICSRGSTTCSIKTELESWVFASKGSVSIVGDVYLQFGTKKDSRRVEVEYRSLQDEQPKDTDPGFAGFSTVDAQFDVAFSRSAKGGASDWWYSNPPYLRVLYVLLIVVSFLLFCCCICGAVFFFHKRRKAKEFVMRELLDMDVKEIDASVDARVDSRASFYSDLEFDTDASANSSDEESITEHFEEDLEDNVCAILFPNNPNPEDLSVSLGQRSQSLPPQHGAAVGDSDGPDGWGESHQHAEDQQLPDSATHNLNNTQPLRSNSMPPVQQPFGYPYPPQTQGMQPYGYSYPNQPPGVQPYGFPPPSGMRQPRSNSMGSRPSQPMGAGRGFPPNGLYGQQQQMNVPLGLSPHRRPPRNFYPQHGPGGTGMPLPPVRGFPPHGQPGKNDMLGSQSEHVRTGMAGPHFGQGLSQSEHGRRASLQGSQMPSYAQRRRVPKGRKAALSNDIGYHPDGLTQIPRVIAEEGSNQPPVVTPLPMKGKKKGNGKLKALDDSNGGSKSKKKKKKAKSKNNQAEESADQKKKVGEKKKKKKEKLLEEAAATPPTSHAIDEDVNLPNDEDVCFEADEQPGTAAFLEAVRNSLKNSGPLAYSPKVYRQIKRQLPNRRFFVCDDEDKPYEWREVTKSELIDLFWKYYEQVKSEMFGPKTKDESSTGEESR